MVIDYEVLTAKEVSEILRPPVHDLQADQAGKDSELSNRRRLAISNRRD